MKKNKTRVFCYVPSVEVDDLAEKGFSVLRIPEDVELYKDELEEANNCIDTFVVNAYYSRNYDIILMNPDFINEGSYIYMYDYILEALYNSNIRADFIIPSEEYIAEKVKEMTGGKKIEYYEASLVNNAIFGRVFAFMSRNPMILYKTIRLPRGNKLSTYLLSTKER